VKISRGEPKQREEHDRLLDRVQLHPIRTLKRRMASDGRRIDPSFAPCDPDVNKSVGYKKNRQYDDGCAKQFDWCDHKKTTLTIS